MKPSVTNITCFLLSLVVIKCGLSSDALTVSTQHDINPPPVAENYFKKQRKHRDGE